MIPVSGLLLDLEPLEDEATPSFTVIHAGGKIGIISFPVLYLIIPKLKY